MIITHTRYAVRCIETDTYRGHRRYDYSRGSHVNYGAFENARIWVRRADAEKQVEPGDEVVEVTVLARVPGDAFARFLAGEATKADLAGEDV
jgi:hypothetical protein